MGKRKFIWTEAAITRLRQLRSGENPPAFNSLRAEFGGLSESVLSTVARQQGITQPYLPSANPAIEVEPDKHHARTAEPLPPGHPISWDLLVKGTILEHEPNPFRFGG